MATMARKLVLPGGSGFLGRMLIRHFAELGWEVVVLTRRPREALPMARAVSWDAATRGDWQREIDGATAIVNLTGRSVDCRYNARNRRAILNSRVESTRVLGQAIQRCAQAPAVWLNMSTATIYRHSLDREMDEASGEIAATPEVKDAFSIQVAQAWEKELWQADTPSTRKVALRTAMVLGTEPGGVYRVLRRLARWGLGGSMASGRQFASWIHERDFCRSVEWLIESKWDGAALCGAVNVVAPAPISNCRMMRIVRAASGIPFGLPASRWMLEVGAVLLRTETELILKSRRVVPGRLAAAGFEFEFPELRGAVAELEARLAAPPSDSQRAASIPPRVARTGA